MEGAVGSLEESSSGEERLCHKRTLSAWEVNSPVLRPDSCSCSAIRSTSGQSRIRHGARRKPGTYGTHVALVFAFVALYAVQVGQSGLLGSLGTVLSAVGTTLVSRVVLVEIAGASGAGVDAVVGAGLTRPLYSTTVSQPLRSGVS